MKKAKKEILEDIRDFMLDELDAWHNEKNPAVKYSLSKIEKANMVAINLAHFMSYVEDMGFDISNERTKRYVKEN